MKQRHHKTESVLCEEQYEEAPQIRLSERDSIAFVNALKYPAPPNEFLQNVRRKYADKRFLLPR